LSRIRIYHRSIPQQPLEWSQQMTTPFYHAPRGWKPQKRRTNHRRI
jgi:hypothetical protein